MVIDGFLYSTGPVKNNCWKSVVIHKSKTNLPISKTVNPHSRVSNLAADVVADKGNIFSLI